MAMHMTKPVSSWAPCRNRGLPGHSETSHLADLLGQKAIEHCKVLLSTSARLGGVTCFTGGREPEARPKPRLRVKPNMGVFFSIRSSAPGVGSMFWNGLRSPVSASLSAVAQRRKLSGEDHQRGTDACRREFRRRSRTARARHRKEKRNEEESVPSLATPEGEVPSSENPWFRPLAGCA